jgi:hypothetical protein
MTQAEQIKKAVGEFGASAKAKLDEGGQPEDQLRNPLEQLFAVLAAECGLPTGAAILVGEKSLAEMRTRPDFAVNVHKALVGFIEVKAPGKGADPRKFREKHDKQQWEKLRSLPNLLYTDGNDFSLWRDGELVGGMVKLIGDVEISGTKLEAPDSLLPLVCDFLSWEPIPPKSVPELARVSARLCRFLRDEVIEQLERGSQPLEQLAKDWRTLLFPDANTEQFADGYAQAVTFGLLMAKSMKLSLAEGLDKVAKSLGKTNSLIGAALRLLTEEQEEEQVLGPSLKTLTRVLDVVDWNQIAKGKPEAWLYFYEDFLEVYDNRLRRLTGSYYTPPEVVHTMVRLCDDALRSSRFGIADGLAGDGVHVADPAIGSGTFLLGVLRRMAETIEANHGGPGAVGPMISEIAERLIGFEIQFGPFAVAQLRLLAEMIDLDAQGSPRLFVTDTLSDPHVDFETGQGIYREISKSQRLANEIKRAQPITVVIGNPPYKEKAKGRGAWIESGSGNKRSPLADWQPPKGWKVGAHAKHLRNLYVYFWRWATWKVFEQGGGGRDKEPPVEEHLSGMVCYITVAGFLNGPGFQKMRSDLRRDCDEIWVIDCSPERHQPEVATRIFQGVQQPVCIVLACRSPANDPAKPARVRFRALAKSHRKAKFDELGKISLGSTGWTDCPPAWREPFLPEFSGGWADFVPLDAIIGDSGSGVMPGRTWIISPDASSLQRRWQALIGESDAARRAILFHPHLRHGKPGDRHAGKAGRSLESDSLDLASVDFGLSNRSSTDPQIAEKATAALAFRKPVRYGFRSFDRQWIIPDSRVINQPNPGLWDTHSEAQVYLSALMAHSPNNGPAISATALIPDLHQYKGSFGGRVFALWKDHGATQPNVSTEVLAQLVKAHGLPVDPVDLFAYVAALLTSPAYLETFRADLVRPGLRVPLTADAGLFAEAATLGRRVIWLHTFGDRFADPAEGRPPGPPRLPMDRAPVIPKGGTISSKPEDFPDALDYDAAKQRLKVGAGHIDNVPRAVWDYEVSGKNVLRQWFSYRKKDRERPQIGDRRPPSPLGDIQPTHWLPEYTSELINVLNVLAMLVELEPQQANLLKRICKGPLIPASKFAF